ncbi:osmotically inducible protein C [Knoellia sinensis KCTC 19936]|uniref:Osmotically inducible protein C n=1 Tax=Knoellia sinensis KCTC 19936 TaxID=1385520 RepID=A0A0A0JCG5_9MICO|nr:Ohr family peroxiredoxin [Knoellia sinensis]KGN33707.1 osmotically inducible protein C [Knoellia sinensis KCTC 19936]
MPHEAVNETLYTIAATAKGGRAGHVTSEDGAVDLPLGKPGSKANPRANPESLFAAGFAACFGNALNSIARHQGLDTTESTVTAKVTLGKTDTGVGLAVELEALVPGVDEDTAQALIAAAHQACPYSKATAGNIDVTVTGRAV